MLISHLDCYSCRYELNLRLRNLYSAWHLTFNKPLSSLCFFPWSLGKMPVGRSHRTLCSQSIFWSTDTRALYIQRVFTCKSIRDGARKYVFIVDALSGLPACVLLQRETVHSSPTSNQDRYWAGLSSVSVFLPMCPSLFEYVCFSLWMPRGKQVQL